MSHGDHHQHSTHQDSAHHHGALGDDESALAELLDLDAEALPDHLPQVTALIQLHADGPIRRIADMGSGTGTGTLALTQRFPDAEVTALDMSATMLEHLSAKAEARGVAERVHTRRTDLDEGWPDLHNLDLVWASNSLHHTADPQRVLRDIHDALRPGGLFALAELTDMPRFLSGELGEVEDRMHTALGDETAAHVPHLGSDWATLITKAGFEIRAEHRFTIAVDPPLSDAAVRLAVATLSRMREGLADRLAPADRTALDALLATDPTALANLAIRDERLVWIARRP
ncbi:class I SAM-dependent methyltransferase [Nocardia alni]|uniref:class I SAM-dependent methyltransferase n=1 Tax=Nocardia alni TaxID=2815723 RepID=UPI001C23F7D1|nr:class I SAM-dependent methyltransferase [Nocardia alni]